MKRLYDDCNLMFKVCDLYYNENLTQADIADKLSLSRPTICRLIQNARESGIVKIELFDPSEHSFSSMERAIEDKFNMQEVIITGYSASDDAVMDMMGRAAEEYLERILRNGDNVGVAMGRSISRIAKFKTSTKKYPDSMFIPLIGGSGITNAEIHCNQVATDFAVAFGSAYQLLHVPGMVSDPILINAIKSDKFINHIFDLMDNVNIAIIGIGGLSTSSTLFSTGYYTEERIHQMEKAEIVGDIMMQSFDKDGVPNERFNKYVLAFDIEKLTKIPHSIGVAGGEDKVPAIIASMKAGYINTLITDCKTAKSILGSEENT